MSIAVQSSPARTITVVHNPPASSNILRQLDTWVAFLPLLFFTARGTFSFENTASNTPMAGTFGTLMASTVDAARHNGEMVAFYAIICLLCVRFYKSIAAAFVENKLITLLPILAIASTAWSQVPTRSLSFGIMALLNTAFAFYLVKRYNHTQQLQLLLAVGVIALLLSFLLVAFYPAAGIDQKENIENAWEGMFGHKNHCAMIMTYLLTPVFYLKLTTQRQRFLRGLYIVATIFLIAMTTSRTGWILLALSVFFALAIRFLRRMNAKERLFSTISIVALAALVAYLVISQAAAIAVILGKDPTLTGRTQIWNALLQPIFKNPLLGYGYYAFWIGFQGEAATTALAIGARNLGNAENGILQMWLELGAVGIFFLLLALYQLCRMAIAVFKRDSSNYVQWCLCIVFLTLATGLVAGDKFMFPHTIEWTLLVMVYASLHERLKELRATEVP